MFSVWAILLVAPTEAVITINEKPDFITIATSRCIFKTFDGHMTTSELNLDCMRLKHKWSWFQDFEPDIEEDYHILISVMFCNLYPSAPQAVNIVRQLLAAPVLSGKNLRLVPDKVRNRSKVLFLAWTWTSFINSSKLILAFPRVRYVTNSVNLNANHLCFNIYNKRVNDSIKLIQQDFRLYQKI